jgi:hypothetical protein
VPTAHDILRDEWQGLHERYGWAIGRYVVMPDHVHFFVASGWDEVKPLSLAIGKWKEWTAKRILALVNCEAPLWQPEFFDHLLRSDQKSGRIFERTPCMPDLSREQRIGLTLVGWILNEYGINCSRPR